MCRDAGPNAAKTPVPKLQLCEDISKRWLVDDQLHSSPLILRSSGSNMTWSAAPISVNAVIDDKLYIGKYVPPSAL